MKKLNFATRITVAGIQRSDMSGAANAERAKVQAEINNHPIKIDKSIFQKTDKEKLELKIEKAHWKKLNSK